MRSTYTTSDLSRRSGDVIADALHHPVTITQRNKPRLVLLSVEDYRRLTGGVRDDPRRAGLTAEMPDDLRREVERAIDAYEREEDA